MVGIIMVGIIMVGIMDDDDDTYDEDNHDDNDDANDDDSACSDEAATGRPAKGFLRTDPFPSNFPRLTNLKQRAPNFKTLGPSGKFGLSADTAFVARQHKLSLRWSLLGAGALIKGLDLSYAKSCLAGSRHAR